MSPVMSASPPSQIFSDQQWQSLLPVLKGLEEPQRLWLSGYLAGMTPQATAADAGPVAADPVIIAYGTETDNSKRLAHDLQKLCEEQGIAAQVVDLGQLRIRRLPKLHHFIVITATHGDGDPPEPVADFFEALMSDEAPAVADMKFSVLALGDSSYEHFCVTGQQIDQRLEALGGTRLTPRQDCDVDFEKPAQEWMAELLPHLPRAAAPQAATNGAAAAAMPAAAATTEYSKDNPLQVEVLDNRSLSHPDRAHPVHHLELALADAALPLAPGDAVGVIPDNPPWLVARILDLSGVSGESAVILNDQAMPLVEALRSHRDLTIASRGFVPFWATLSGDKALTALAEGEAAAQRNFLRDHQLIDIMLQAPARPDAQELVDNLRPLQPRLYDLANSLEELDDEIHLTVKDFRYTFGQREETGIASRFLLELQVGDMVRVYPHRNVRFHLPEESGVPLLLIAEGTGIAPYRAFLQELQQRNAKSWLVFAEGSFEEDFLYQTDIQQAHSSGVLNELDTVFYNDQPGRNLADPVLENIDRLQAWIDEGAHIYLCGERKPLADCEAALESRLDEMHSTGFWKQLSKSKRIHRNVY